MTTVFSATIQPVPSQSLRWFRTSTRPTLGITSSSPTRAFASNPARCALFGNVSGGFANVPPWINNTGLVKRWMIASRPLSDESQSPALIFSAVERYVGRADATIERFQAGTWSRVGELCGPLHEFIPEIGISQYPLKVHNLPKLTFGCRQRHTAGRVQGWSPPLSRLRIHSPRPIQGEYLLSQQELLGTGQLAGGDGGLLPAEWIGIRQ